jgi:tetratricopeptide (TPR) repeat protein
VKRRWLLCGAIAAVGVGVWWSQGEPEPDSEPTVGPTAVPLGETTQQILPGPDGEPEVWTLRKREARPEEAVVDDLPEPKPRESPADEATDSARALTSRAQEAWKHGDIQAAMAHFEAAIDADPDDWLPRSEYSRLLVMMTNYPKAQPHLERAAELRPDSPRVWLDLYSYYQRTLQLERALKARERAEELAGGRAIEQDETGLWRLEGDSIYP